MRTLSIGLALMCAALVMTTVRAGEADDQKALLKALPMAKVSLQQGLAASESTGRPISVKFEVEDGKLQLSVYTAKDGKFSEVIVDYTTGKVAKAEAITEGGDLAAAKSQAAAMAKAKQELKAAVAGAEAGAPGYRAVSAIPNAILGRATATVMLVKDGAVKTLQESLD